MESTASYLSHCRRIGVQHGGFDTHVVRVAGRRAYRWLVRIEAVPLPGFAAHQKGQELVVGNVLHLRDHDPSRLLEELLIRPMFVEILNMLALDTKCGRVRTRSLLATLLC